MGYYLLTQFDEPGYVRVMYNSVCMAFYTLFNQGR